MKLLKELLLGGYYLASTPARRRAATLRSARKMEPIRVLFYHRVADQHPNGWTMPCETFRRQIEWITANYDVISLEEAQRRIQTGENPWPAVCLTFDDGYAENCEFALPLLLRQNLPFTYFVSTNHVLRGEPFAHDQRNGIALEPNSPAEIKALAGAGVEIGAHTQSHADIAQLTSDKAIREEIAGSRQALEELTGVPVRYFAFPFGLHQNLSQQAFCIAFEEGLKGVCSAYGAYNWPGDDPFHLRRIHADPEMIRLKNWLTIDPRKTAVSDFDPGDYQQSACPAAAPVGGVH